jgi:hypothetical protein
MDDVKQGEQGMDKQCSMAELQWQGTEGFRFALANHQLLGDGMYGGKLQAHGNGGAVKFGSDQAARMAELDCCLALGPSMRCSGLAVQSLCGVKSVVLYRM